MNGATAALFAPLYALPAGSIPQALEQLSPTIYGDALLAGRSTWRAFADQVSAQLDARRRGGQSGTTAPGPNGSTAWTSAFGELQQVASSDVPGFQSSVGGVMAGIDTALGGFARVGFAVGGGSTRTWANNGASASGAALQLALYGEMSAGSFFLGGQAAYLVIDQAIARPLGSDPASHWARSVVLPNPAGAETRVSLAFAPRSSRARRRDRSTTRCRAIGTCSLVAMSGLAIRQPVLSGPKPESSLSPRNEGRGAPCGPPLPVVRSGDAPLRRDAQHR